MPRRDGTGPMGQGTMTGRGLGLCADFNDARCGLRRGFGRGMGDGYGCRSGSRRFGMRQLSNIIDKEFLLAKKDLFEKRIDAIKKQLENLSETK